MDQWQAAVRRRTRHLLRALAAERPFSRRGDLVLLLVLLAPSVLEAPKLSAWPVGWLAAAAVVGAAVAVGRAAPLLSLALATSLNLFYLWLGGSLWTVPAAVVLGFLAGSRVTRLSHAHAAFALVAVAGLVLTSAFADVKDWLSLLLVEFGASVLPWWAGNWWRQRTELVHAGWERAERLEREQRFTAEQARLKERAHIAEDMHDSLGHELSVMALLAGGLELAPDLPERHRASVAQLRERSIMATERLHEVIGLLRDDSAPSLKPADETVAELVRRFERSGVPVRFREEGERPRLTPIADRAAYRVVQEALTNAVKHAPGAAIAVRVVHQADGTVVSVVNEPPGGGARPPGAGSGSGLIGLDERVRLAGGSLRTGPRAGGFEVVARLPRTPSAAAPAGADRATDPAAEPSARSASTAELRQAKTRLRRNVVRASLIPVLLGVGLAVLLAGLHVFTSVTTSLAPDDYERMRPGQPRGELAEALPGRRISKPPPVVAEPPAPRGASCEYYRASDSLFELPDTMYRLCFDNGVLVAKDTLYSGVSR